MKKTIAVLSSILLLVVLCVLIPAFAPVWITHGLMLFMLLAIVIALSTKLENK